MGERKEKSSRARDAALIILQHRTEPISLEDLHRLVKIKQPATAFSTIYRLMKKLEEQHKVTRIDWRERGSRYEWADQLHHHHIVCTVCGKTADIDDTYLQIDENLIAQKTGFSFSRHYVELEGICPTCRTQTNSKK